MIGCVRGEDLRNYKPVLAVENEDIRPVIELPFEPAVLFHEIVERIHRTADLVPYIHGIDDKAAFKTAIDHKLFLVFLGKLLFQRGREDDPAFFIQPAFIFTDEICCCHRGFVSDGKYRYKISTLLHFAPLLITFFNG